MKWYYNNEEYNEIHNPEVYGFIYLVNFENEDGEVYKYYGKKNFYSENEINALLNGNKREGHIKFLNRNRNGKRTKREVGRTESKTWRNYTGSCKDTEGFIPISKEILCFANDKRELTYLETKALFARGALSDDKCLNGNILGRFFRGNIGNG